MSQPFNSLVSAARALVIFVAVMGFFLGQILLGEFSLWKSLAGVLGIAAAGAVGHTGDQPRKLVVAVAAVCALARPCGDFRCARLFRTLHACSKYLSVVIDWPLCSGACADRNKSPQSIESAVLGKNKAFIAISTLDPALLWINQKPDSGMTQRALATVTGNS
jgi:hypothetical protein